MKKVNKDQLAAYLLDDLDPEDRRQLEMEISASTALQQELEGLKRVLGLFDQQPEVEPSPYSRDLFYQFLNMEAGKKAPAEGSGFRIHWWAAAAMALLVIGIGFGVVWKNHSRQQEQISRLSREVVETRKLLLLAMMEDPSASERIRAMNVSSRDLYQDQRVVDALINRLRNDENVNVRLKAAEALGAYMDRKEVAQAGIEALEKDPSPEVQIMLIESLVIGKRKEAVPSFRRMLDREDIPKVVRDLAAYGLENMI